MPAFADRYGRVAATTNPKDLSALMFPRTRLEARCEASGNTTGPLLCQHIGRDAPAKSHRCLWRSGEPRCNECSCLPRCFGIAAFGMVARPGDSSVTSQQPPQGMLKPVPGGFVAPPPARLGRSCHHTAWYKSRHDARLKRPDPATLFYPDVLSADLRPLPAPRG